MKSNAMHKRDETRSFKKHGRIGAAMHQPVSMDAELKVFDWLVNELLVAGPQVAIHESLARSIEELINRLRQRKVVPAHVISPKWYLGVDWPNIDRKDGVRCAVKRLMFAVSMQDICNFSETKVSLAKAAELALRCLDSGDHLRFRHKGEKCWIESTELGVEKFGFWVKLEFNGDVDDDMTLARWPWPFQ